MQIQFTLAMNAVKEHDSAWANEMNFVMNHAPGAGSLARPVDQQSSAVPRMSQVYLSKCFFVVCCAVAVRYC